MSTEPPRRTLVVDADDTLWENNVYFEESIEEFIDHLDHSTLDRAGVREALAEVERATIVEHGYGSDSFGRSLRACFALHAERQPTDGDLAVLTMLGRRILEQPVQLLDGVVDTLEQLYRRHRLVLLTKGQPDEQRVKIERSGLQPYFSQTRVVPEKTRDTYVRLLEELGSVPAETFMIGNSPRSDINPALAAGMHAVYVPHRSTWVLEQQDLDHGHERLHVVDRFEALVPLLLGDPDNGTTSRWSRG